MAQDVQDLEVWLPRLAAYLAEIPGLEAVYHPFTMPASLTLLPMPLGILTTVDGTVSPAGVKTTDYSQLQLTLFGTQQFIPECHALLVPFVTRVRNKVAAGSSLSGYVVEVRPSSEAKFWQGPGAVTYGDGEYGALIFRLEVKHQTNNITVSA